MTGSGLVASGHETVAKTLGDSLRYPLTHQERWQQLATVEVLTRRLPGLCRVPDQALRYVPSGVLRRLKNLYVE